MRRLRYIPVLLGLLVFAAAGAHAAFSSHAAVSSTMHAFVHDDESIGLTFDDGSLVGNQARTPPVVPAGTYTIRAVDDSGAHNFHLQGPGTDVGTTIGGTGTPTWTVTLTAGHYRFQCDDHPDFMYGEFDVSGGAGGGTASGGSTSGGGTSSGGTSSGGSTSGGSTSSGGTSSNTGSKASTSSALLGTLAGRVTPSGKLALTKGGRAVASLTAGRYKVTVADNASGRSFLVRQAGHAAKTITGVAFVGTRSVTLTLAPGKWTFYTSAGPKSTSSFLVTS
jgi:hypothetical protein